MGYKHMIMIEHLVETILNSFSAKQYKTVFKIENSFYSGNFLKQDEYRRDYAYTYSPIMGHKKEINVFSIDNIDKKQEVRSAYFEFVFGPNKNPYNNSLDSYASNPEAVFRHIVEFAYQYEKDFLNPKINFDCIYNLENLDTKRKFDFYLLSDENITPVSIVEIDE